MIKSLAMSEMLGNQYFLARNFELATEQYEKSLIKTPDNLFIKKKLILCYIKIGNLEKALKILIQVLDKNAEVIFSTNEEIDDCPCRELIDEVDAITNEKFSDEKKNIALGILWLYCDINKSMEMFKKVSNKSKYNFEINRIIQSLNII